MFGQQRPISKPVEAEGRFPISCWAKEPIHSFHTTLFNFEICGYTELASLKRGSA
jgi:hypothetical protein